MTKSLLDALKHNTKRALKSASGFARLGSRHVARLGSRHASYYCCIRRTIGRQHVITRPYILVQATSSGSTTWITDDIACPCEVRFIKTFQSQKRLSPNHVQLLNADRVGFANHRLKPPEVKLAHARGWHHAFAAARAMSSDTPSVSVAWLGGSSNEHEPPTSLSIVTETTKPP